MCRREHSSGRLLPCRGSMATAGMAALSWIHRRFKHPRTMSIIAAPDSRCSARFFDSAASSASRCSCVRKDGEGRSPPRLPGLRMSGAVVAMAGSRCEQPARSGVHCRARCRERRDPLHTIPPGTGSVCRSNPGAGLHTQNLSLGLQPQPTALMPAIPPCTPGAPSRVLWCSRFGGQRWVCRCRECGEACRSRRLSRWWSRCAISQLLGGRVSRSAIPAVLPARQREKQAARLICAALEPVT